MTAFFYGWVVVAAGTVGIIFSIPGQTMGFSVFTDILIEELGLTRVQLSTAYLIGTALSGFSMPLLGRLFDRLGARKMVVGSAMATGLVLFYLSGVAPLARALGGLMAPVAASFLVITLGFSLMRAAAQGVLTMTSRNMIGKWFDYRRGMALAVRGVATSFAFSVAPRFLDALIGRFGYDGAWQVLGVVTIVVMAGGGWLFFRDNPEECGLVMDGPVKSERKRQAHPDSLTPRDFTRPEALKTGAFWIFNLTFAFFSLFSTAFTFHIVSIGELAGRDRVEILSFFVPMALLSVAMNVFCGWASARTRLKYLLAMMNGTALLGVVGTMHLEAGWGAFAFIVGNGLCGGAFSALTGIVWPRFFGRTHLGSISGFAMSAMVLASALGPIAFGLSLDLAGSYTPALWVAATVPAALGLASFFADNPQRVFEKSVTPP
ncbi:MFS transporter [soil metagenome]